MVLVCLPAFICQPACNPVGQSLSQMSQCFSCHGSAHKCLFVSLSPLQTQVLHRPVNGFVRWPFHRASLEDGQQTAIRLSVCLHVCACVCVCVFMCMFQSQASRISSGNKRPPKYPHTAAHQQKFLSVALQSSCSRLSLSVIQPAIILNNRSDMLVVCLCKYWQNPGKFT